MEIYAYRKRPHDVKDLAVAKLDTETGVFTRMTLFMQPVAIDPITQWTGHSREHFVRWVNNYHSDWSLSYGDAFWLYSELLLDEGL